MGLRLKERAVGAGADAGAHLLVERRAPRVQRNRDPDRVAPWEGHPSADVQPEIAYNPIELGASLQITPYF